MHDFRFAEIMGALSKALDMTGGQPRGHSVRCCWIGMTIGRQFGLEDSELADLYYAILLKDLGCSSNAAAVNKIFRTCDINLKKGLKSLDGSFLQGIKFILSNTGNHENLVGRLRSIFKVMGGAGEIRKEIMEIRCDNGASIARMLRLSESVAVGIYYLTERWDGSGAPHGLKALDIPTVSQITLLAQVIENTHFDKGREEAIKEIRKRSGVWFDPRLTKTFEEICESTVFWDTLESSNVDSAVYNLEPGKRESTADEDYLDDIAVAFSQVIDAKSPFTYGHSERVSTYSDLIAEQLQLDEAHRRWIKRGALLHDIGKLGVSNAILDKPGKLTDEEWSMIKMHPVFSYEILSQASIFDNILPLVRGHHERLDGKGYPDGLSGDQITLETRIVTVADIFDALTADRPYRKAMPTEKALSIMFDDTNKVIDADCYHALIASLKKIGRRNAA